MRHGHKTGLSFERQKPIPAKDSFWVGKTRAELRAGYEDRRAQQRIPTETDLQNEPALQATQALMQDHRWLK